MGFLIFVLPASAEVIDTQSSSTCPVVSGFMKLGATNDTREVAKLQTFLRTNEKSDVEVSGIFDDKTVAAVDSFQRKYMSETMTPWGATRGTGIVHVTTGKKINQLACGEPLTLTEAELAMIEAYKRAATLAEGQADTVVTGVTFEDVSGPTAVTYGKTIAELMDSVDPKDMVAAVPQSTIASKFWAFIAGLFR